MAGTEGLNLAAAGEVIFAERFFNPGKEWQAEDRINRPEQITPPRITYMIPLEPFSLAYSNRLEQKRNSIYQTLGEAPTSDYSRPLDPTELARALRLNQDAMIDPRGTERDKKTARLILAAFRAELNPEQFLLDELERLNLDFVGVRSQFESEGAGVTPEDRAAAQRAGRRARERALRERARERERARPSVKERLAARKLDPKVQAANKRRAFTVWQPFGSKSLLSDVNASMQELNRLFKDDDTPEYDSLVQDFFEKINLDVEVVPYDARAVNTALQSKEEIVFVGYPIGLFTARHVFGRPGSERDTIRKRPFESTAGAVGTQQSASMKRSQWTSALEIPNTGMVTIQGRPLTMGAVLQAASPTAYKEHLDVYSMQGDKYPLSLNPRRKKNMARSRRSGKYAAVWNKYGQKGFGIPTMAPHKGSYPLYPEYRAKFALVLIAGPAYDKKKGERGQIAKRALAAHPSLKSFWAARKKTIEARMEGSGGSRRMVANPSHLTPKQVLVRAGSESDLIELIPLAEDALLALGAADVRAQPIQNIHAGEYTALFIVEGLGGGKRWSSTQKRQFRKLVSDSLPSQIREPNFQNASSVLAPRDLEEVQASVYAREYGVGMQTPDSDRTRRAKARSKARRKLTRRPNSKSRR